jgi:hypothetical protein
MITFRFHLDEIFQNQMDIIRGFTAFHRRVGY